MKKILFLLVGILFISGCGYQSFEYQSVTTGEKFVDCSDVSITNPYEEGTGHYAGWEWAEKKEPVTCGGNSSSFIDGCKMYQTQQRDRDMCEQLEPRSNY